MDTNKPEHKEAAHASVEAELEEVYAQLEEARAKLAEIKSRANTEDAPGVSAAESGEEAAVVAGAAGAVEAESCTPVTCADTTPVEVVAEPMMAGQAGIPVEEGAAQDAAAQVDATTQAPQPDWTPYASVPPQTPPAVPPYEPPTYNQAPPQTPPQQPYYQQPYYQPQYVQTKDHVAAGLLAIFLGSLGIHKFYLGYNTAGFIMLAVTTIGSLLTFGLAGAVMALIGLIEGIVYLVKSQSEFEQVYVFNKRDWF